MCAVRALNSLQKSMDLTPLLPRAGPTGGEGEAWPAPTMSLTITSLGGVLRAMSGKDEGGVAEMGEVRLMVESDWVEVSRWDGRVIGCKGTLV